MTDGLDLGVSLDVDEDRDHALDLWPARVTVDLDAISANVRTLRERVGGTELMAVVKADAYGHGLVPSARAALAGPGRGTAKERLTLGTEAFRGSTGRASGR